MTLFLVAAALLALVLVLRRTVRRDGLGHRSPPPTRRAWTDDLPEWQRR
ncbi:hypothetical protein [Oerskovia flava]|nr:hypothetical protein [Oerskovia sp. JB1-3-2]